MAKNLSKKWSRWLLGSALLLGSAIPWQTASAERLLTENFDYPIGSNLVGQGGWVKYYNNTATPVTINEGNLTYPGYMDEQIGGMVNLFYSSSGADQDPAHNFGTADKAVKSGSVYAAFIANFQFIPESTAPQHFFTFLSVSPTTWGNANFYGTEAGRLYATTKNCATGKFRLCVNRTTASFSSITEFTPEFDMEQNLLIIVKYEFVEGASNNDIVSVFVNPVISETEPEALARYTITSGSDASSSNGIYGVELRQGKANSTSGNTAPQLDLDALRVATSWEDLFDAGGGGDVTVPTITASQTEITLPNTYQYIPVSTTVKVSGKDLTGDITVTCPEGVTAETTTITKEQAEAGYDLKLTVTPQASGKQNYTVQLSSEDAEELNVNLMLNVTACNKVDNLGQLLTATGGAYVFAGTGVVTAVTNSYGTPCIYVQDESGAAMFIIYGNNPYKVGDKITGGLGTVYDAGSPVLEMEYDVLPVVVEENVAVEPLVVAAADFTSAFAKQNLYRLISVEGAKFDSPDGKTFSTSAATLIGVGGATFTAQALAGSDLIGKELPSKKVNLTGISLSASALSMGFRTEADVVESAVVPTLIADKTYFRLSPMMQGNSVTEYLTLTAADLEGDVTITCPATIVCDRTTVTKEEAMTESGVTLKFTITPAEGGEYNGKVTLASEGAESVELEFFCSSVTPVINLASSADLMAQLSDPNYEANIYRYTGKAVITAVNTFNSYSGEVKNYYAQDEKGGIYFSGEEYGDMSMQTLNVGDEVTNILGFITEVMTGAPSFIMYPMGANGEMAEVVATGKTVTPQTATIAQVKAAPKNYLYRLVTLNDVRFTPAADVTKFSTSFVDLTDGTNTAKAQAIGGAPIIGTDIPAGFANVTGISTSAGTCTLGLVNVSDIEVLPAKLTLSSDSENLRALYQGATATRTVTLIASNLVGDVTVTCPASITCDKTTITKEEAMAEGGVKLTFTVTPDKGGNYSATVTLATEGGENATIVFTADVTPVTNLASSADIMAQLSDPDFEGNLYRYTGKAVITAISTASTMEGDEKTYYAQDENGGIAFLADAYYALFVDQTLNVGDEITNIMGAITSSLGAPTFSMYPVGDPYVLAEVTATGKTVAPAEATIAEMNAAANSYLYRLVTIKDVRFAQGIDKFSTAFIDLTDGTNTAKVKALPGTPIIGTDIPTGFANVTGVSISAAICSLGLVNASDIEVLPAQLTLSSTEENLRQVYQGVPTTKTVTLTASNLTGDVTITCPATITCDKTTITKDEAMAEGGVELTFTVTPDRGGDYSAKVTIASEGAENATIEFTADVTKVTSLANSTALMNQLDDPDLEDNTYKYAGKAVITYIESISSRAGDYKKYYAQDMFGGLCFSTEFAGVDPGLKVGDEISNIYGVILLDQKAPVFYMQPMGDKLAEVTAEGKTKTPSDITIADITATTAETYLYRLVKVSDIKFVAPEGVTTFSDDETLTITDGEKEAKAKPFFGSQIIGTDIPTGSCSVVGISTSIQGFTLGLMNSTDIEAGAPTATITPEKLFDGAAAPMGEKTAVYKYTVVAENLKADAPVSITGANADQFSVEPAAVPAGSGTTVVTVYYEPTAIGSHKGNVYFDFDASSAALNQSFSLGTLKAYDPQNLPTITITPDEVELVAQPGEKVTAEVKLTASGCFDYITGARQGTGDNGGITVSTTYMLPTSVDAPIVITFQPKAEGEFTETFTYTTTMCSEPATLTIKGICKGAVEPEPTEGQDFELSMENPQAWYKQDFTSVEKNKVLSIEGWTNSALEGQRAWWGYVGEEDGEEFHAAKCTAYDSTLKPEQSIEKQQMILVSPALDYKNAEDKTLKFRLMGMFLTEDSGDNLEVCLVEQGDEGYVISAMDGFNIPATADEAGEWIPYVVDMSVVPDMPDTFFIGFRFNYTRGVENATTYYITDFEWGKEPVSLDMIRLGNLLSGAKADADGLYSVYNMQGIRVLRVADAEGLQRLPAGFYIVGGKKTYLK